MCPFWILKLSKEIVVRMCDLQYELWLKPFFFSFFFHHAIRIRSLYEENEVWDKNRRSLIFSNRINLIYEVSRWWKQTQFIVSIISNQIIEILSKNKTKRQRSFILFVELELIIGQMHHSILFLLSKTTSLSVHHRKIWTLLLNQRCMRLGCDSSVDVGGKERRREETWTDREREKRTTK